MDNTEIIDKLSKYLKKKYNRYSSILGLNIDFIANYVDKILTAHVGSDERKRISVELKQQLNLYNPKLIVSDIHDEIVNKTIELINKHANIKSSELPAPTTLIKHEAIRKALSGYLKGFSSRTPLSVQADSILDYINSVILSKRFNQSRCNEIRNELQNFLRSFPLDATVSETFEKIVSETISLVNETDTNSEVVEDASTPPGSMMSIMNDILSRDNSIEEEMDSMKHDELKVIGLLTALEQQNLQLIKEYKEEIKFANAIQEDIRRERTQFFTINLREITATLATTHVNEKIKAEWLQDIVDSYIKSLEISSQIAKSVACSTLEMIREEKAKLVAEMQNIVSVNRNE
ncbi:MAG: hypothetical protein WCP79_13755 [Bacillota bacterium]